MTNLHREQIGILRIQAREKVIQDCELIWRSLTSDADIERQREETAAANLTGQSNESLSLSILLPRYC